MSPAVRRILLIIIIASIGISTVLGVGGIITEIHFAFGSQVLLSALVILISSLGCFASSYALDKRRSVVMGYLGLGFAVLVGIVGLLTIWLGETIVMYMRTTSYSREGEILLARIMGSVASLGVVFPISAYLLSLQLKGFARFVRTITIICYMLALGSLWITMWSPESYRSDLAEFCAKLCACLFILGLAGSITTSILSKFYSIKSEEMTEFTPSLHLTCPRCLTPQEVLVGESACCHCRLKFKIEIEEPRCNQCGYMLRGLTRPICPECGAIFSESELANVIAAPSAPAPLT